MTIHSAFWRERRSTHTLPGAYLRSVRDSNRQRSYNAEFKHLRPVQSELSRQAAKGYARLCAKIAIRQMCAMGLLMDHEVERVRNSFRAAFTKETIGHCNANANGAYFAAWGWTDCVIAHEVAHWADQWAHKLTGNPGFRIAYEPHGPKWRGWFAYILSHAGMKRVGHRADVQALVLEAWADAGLPCQFPDY